jgi:hypothetical protein
MILERLKVMLTQSQCDHRWWLRTVVVRLPSEGCEDPNDTSESAMVQKRTFECWAEPYSHECFVCRKKKLYPEKQRCKHDWKPVDDHDTRKDWSKHLDVTGKFNYDNAEKVAVCSKCGTYRYRLVNAIPRTEHASDIDEWLFTVQE